MGNCLWKFFPILREEIQIEWRIGLILGGGALIGAQIGAHVAIFISDNRDYITDKVNRSNGQEESYSHLERKCTSNIFIGRKSVRTLQFS